VIRAISVTHMLCDLNGLFHSAMRAPKGGKRKQHWPPLKQRGAGIQMEYSSFFRRYTQGITVREGLFLCADGAACKAKLNEQRTRRVSSLRRMLRDMDKSIPATADQLRELSDAMVKLSVESPGDTWTQQLEEVISFSDVADMPPTPKCTSVNVNMKWEEELKGAGTAGLTPGSWVMRTLDSETRAIAARRLIGASTTHGHGQRVQPNLSQYMVTSGSDVPGEGEHKCLRYAFDLINADK
ncbi:hypothetical protein KIPB_009336, partial [Kipferlia bialata]